MKNQKYDYVKMLRDCADSVHDLAEEFIGKEGYNCGWKVTINIPVDGLPSVTAERTIAVVGE